MKVAVTQSINCAHQLPGTELHGHTYRVTVIRYGELAPDGMVIPLDRLAAHLDRVLRPIDHQRLEVVIGEPATAERLAWHIKEAMPIPVVVRVQIGDGGYVETEE